MAAKQRAKTLRGKNVRNVSSKQASGVKGGRRLAPDQSTSMSGSMSKMPKPVLS